MKIVITGIAGFVGSRITQYLLCAKPNLEIWGIDNLSRRGSENNLSRLRQLGCRVHHGDLRIASDLEVLPATDWVIDCAGNPSVLAGVDSGTGSLVGHNLIGTLNLLEKCRRDNSGLILLSSSRVYSIDALRSIPLIKTAARFEYRAGGDESAGVSSKGVCEQFSTSAPVSLYGATKLASEVMALEYSHSFGLPVRIIRCGVIAGAGQFGKADQGIFSYWIHSHRAGRELKFIGYGGTGLQVRDCLHPRDLARLVLSQLKRGQGRDQSTLCNAAGGRRNSMSLHELNSWCSERFGKCKIDCEQQNRPFDVPWLILDSDLALKQWQWEPEVTLFQILEEISEHAATHPDWLKHCS